MLIGDLAKKAGVSRHTIRYYEDLGLISVGKKERRENNYKEYSLEALDKILTINKLKILGFTLTEIKEIINIFLEEANPCADILDSVNKKIHLLDQKMIELLEVKSRLQKVKNDCNGNCKIDDILPTCVDC